MLAIGIFAVAMAVVHTVVTLLAAPEGRRLRKLQGALGLPTASPIVVVAAMLLWLALALLLAGGLCYLIWLTLTQNVIPSDDQRDLWSFRFRLAQLVALTTVLGAVVALPITLTRLRLAREDNATAKEALFNQKVTEAAADLYARRQVTLRPIEGGPVNGWEDDVVRRNAAIDRLEGLVRERPEEAERVARLLSTYVRELSSEHRPKPVPETEDVAKITRWAHDLRPVRSDMENAAQVLGRLARVNDSDAVRGAIDLRGANLQGFDLRALSFNGADMTDAHMQGAKLEAARLHRTRLGWASLHGATLDRAQLQEACLDGAWLQGALLEEAQLERAVLTGARMQQTVLYGAHLGGALLDGAYLQDSHLIMAQLQRASLASSHLQNADIYYANLAGANLDRVEIDQNTVLIGAYLKGAAISFVDATTMGHLKAFWGDIFADGSLPVPEEDRPDHWASEKLAPADFREAWRAWQRSIGMDPDDPK
ncbi:pentapeptide repeat-containing protein [Rhodosalinus sediminis]|uniref:pentapeptide repeat-containing protein n=1 Tax=Rhodosalinus sediminis TaxID=1940533 RepID=UPI002351F929|nr:pentapeptide repeat-containing protein [Rhodosalinus sediminis]